MKLFKMENHNLQVEEAVWGLLPFQDLLKRDKTKHKEIANKEMLFIYYFSDIRSDYVYITDDVIRAAEIKKDIGLPEKWELDSLVQVAIDFYNSKSTTPIANLYKSSLKSVDDISNYLKKTDSLLNERTDKGSVVTAINTITASLKLVPGLMRDLKAAYKEVIAEQKEMEGRTKGSRTLGMFEDGLYKYGRDRI